MFKITVKDDEINERFVILVDSFQTARDIIFKRLNSIFKDDISKIVNFNTVRELTLHYAKMLNTLNELTDESDFDNLRTTFCCYNVSTVFRIEKIDEIDAD